MEYNHVIDIERCKGCGLCIEVCPKNVLQISGDISEKGYFPAFQARPEDCIFCTACCIMCPDVAITILKNVKEKEAQ
ncbi:MAG: 2-oxoacid:acceptor oxidoreductase [Desulfobacteraceae bacterium 4572_19]|nr:MAG: 2-oxoacid:acceptor oxidoreductase [Desulfobacteraceae bacterium 4572_19]